MGALRTIMTVATLTVIAVAAAHSADAPKAADKLSPESFEQKLQDTRDNISRDRSTGPVVPAQTVVDICKKNPSLPQCKL